MCPGRRTYRVWGAHAPGPGCGGSVPVRRRGRGWRLARVGQRSPQRVLMIVTFFFNKKNRAPLASRPLKTAPLASHPLWAPYGLHSPGNKRSP